MRRFAQLYQQLDRTTKTNEKVAAMVHYLDQASPADAAWAIYFLSDHKLRQLVPTALVRRWAAEAAGVPDWLFEESYHSVGDLAETVSLIVPPGTADEDQSLTHWIEQRLQPLRTMDEARQYEAVQEIWQRSSVDTRFVIMKLITGAFRVGVSKGLVTRAIAAHAKLPTEVIAHRLMGDWPPTADAYLALVHPDHAAVLSSQPYPFCLAHPVAVDQPLESLGPATDYVAEWKWDGIRGQVIRRAGRTFIWSRGEELMEGRWPEIEAAAAVLPEGTVLDGEILACDDIAQVLPFAQLQRRIGRKSIGKKLLAEVPVKFFAFDLLEADGVDLRSQPFDGRRRRLEQLVSAAGQSQIRVTELLTNDQSSWPTWDDWRKVREQSRQKNAEGLMLKRRDSVYETGRVTGSWWKWKVSPYSIDAVLIYAQKGHGRRANLYTDYTFAVWHDGALVPFAKAYSGLTDAEIREVDRFVREHTQETFGPVRSVKPELVMELAFEGLQRSTRHKSGIATRFPRIARWRHDKRPGDANSLEDLLRLLPDSIETTGAIQSHGG